MSRYCSGHDSPSTELRGTGRGFQSTRPSGSHQRNVHKILTGYVGEEPVCSLVLESYQDVAKIEHTVKAIPGFTSADGPGTIADCIVQKSRQQLFSKLYGTNNTGGLLSVIPAKFKANMRQMTNPIKSFCEDIIYADWNSVILN